MQADRREKDVLAVHTGKKSGDIAPRKVVKILFAPLHAHLRL
jgi:hypothetical protein